MRNILFNWLLLFSASVMAAPTAMKLENIEGNTEPLSNYLGKGDWIIANIWSPSCSACIVELPRLKKFISDNPDIPVIGITLDFPSFGYGKMDVLHEFVKNNPLQYPLFLADIDQTSELIGRRLAGIPSITIFHPDGRPLVTWPGVIEINEIEHFIKNYQEETEPLSVGF